MKTVAKQQLTVTKLTIIGGAAVTAAAPI